MEGFPKKKKARGIKRLYYYGALRSYVEIVRRINSKKNYFYEVIFRAENKKIILENVKSIPLGCVSSSGNLLSKIPIKKTEFIADKAFHFEGVALGIVQLNNDKYLELEVVPGRLYIYFPVIRAYRGSEECYIKLLEIA